MKIAIFGNTYQRDKLKKIQNLFEFLLSQKVDMYVEERFLSFVDKESVFLKKVNRIFGKGFPQCDMAISVGGDGSFLQTANKLGERKIPILGINTGHLGFLSGISIDKIEVDLMDILQGFYRVEERSLLSLCSSYPSSLRIEDCNALNEIVIAKRDSSSMIKVSVKINGEYLATYRGDGLIISTPTGSTAYSLSVNGPILSPQLPCILLTPISSHSLNVRPFVVNEDSKIELSVSGRDDHFLVAIDGRSHTFDMNTMIELRKSPYKIGIVQTLNHTFYNTLRQKLNWGELPQNC